MNLELDIAIEITVDAQIEVHLKATETFGAVHERRATWPRSDSLLAARTVLKGRPDAAASTFVEVMKALGCEERAEVFRTLRKAYCDKCGADQAESRARNGRECQCANDT